MENFLNGLLDILEYADAHDGIVAMLGIAVTVLIFRKEVVNNFYTLEKENFNEVFRPAYKEIPKKIKKLETARQENWNDCFEELLNAFTEMLEGANYFRYTMPYLYKLLNIYIGEIEDFSRHDNWRLYRCSEKQLRLITKKARKIIKVIDNASKGKVFIIKLSCSQPVRTIKTLFARCFVDRPYDRIMSCVTKATCYDAICFNDTKGEAYSKDVLQKLKWGHLQIVPQTGIADVKVVPIQTTQAICFGYLCNLRIGKRIGKIILKTSKDRSVKIRSKHHLVKLDWTDNWAHKIVVMWRKMGDDNHIFYDVVKIRQYIE